MNDIINLVIKKPLFFLFCLFIPFDNTPLQNFGGIMTASPSSLILVPGFLVLLLERKSIKFHSKFLFFYLITLVVSFVYYFYWSFHLYKLDSFFIFDRGFRYFLLYAFYFMSFFYCFGQSYKVIVAGAKLIVLIIFISIIVNYVSPNFINNPSIIQANVFTSSDRLRGFSLEASLFGFQLVCSALMLGILLRLRLLFVISYTVALAILTTSKGSALSFLICICIFFAVNGGALFRVLLSLIMISLSYYIFKYYFFEALSSDIDSYTSVATRSTMFLTGLKVFMYNPLGVGYFGYIPSIYDYAPELITYMKGLFPILNFSEVSSYTLFGQYKAIGTKSMFIDCLMIFGVFFLVPFFYYSKKILNSFILNKDGLSFSLLLFVILSNIFFISHVGSYVTTFVVAFLVMRYKRYEGKIV